MGDTCTVDASGARICSAGNVITTPVAPAVTYTTQQSCVPVQPRYAPPKDNRSWNFTGQNGAYDCYMRSDLKFRAITWNGGWRFDWPTATEMIPTTTQNCTTVQVPVVNPTTVPTVTTDATGATTTVVPAGTTTVVMPGTTSGGYAAVPDTTTSLDLSSGTSMLSGIPTWALVAGGVGGALLLMSMMKR
jgi:hypothetical protein